MMFADLSDGTQIGAMAGADIVSTPLAEFQRFLDVNSRGTFLVTRMASIAMRAQELQAVSQSSPGQGTTRGAIVNLGSASSMVAIPGVLPYTTSKHATLGISKSAGGSEFFPSSRQSAADREC